MADATELQTATREIEVKRFLLDAAYAFADTPPEELEHTPGSWEWTFRDGLWVFADNGQINQRRSVVKGGKTISANGWPLWRENYELHVYKPDALRFYIGQVATRSEEDFPVCGPRLFRAEGLHYTFASTRAVMVVGNYAINEVIRDTSTRQILLDGHRRGGWVAETA